MIPEAEQQYQCFKVAVRFFFQEIQQSLYFFTVSRLAFAVYSDQHHSPFKNPEMMGFPLYRRSMLLCLLRLYY